MQKLIAAFVTLFVAALAFAAPASAQSARIHLIHGIPGVDVDVEAGGDNVFEDFKFGDTQDLSAFAGATLEDLKVKVAGGDAVAIDAGDVALPGSGNFTIIAHLDADGTPTLGVFENNVSSIAAGQGRITVRHTASAPAVDILANGAVAFGDVPNGAGADTDLGAGTITVEVVPAGESSPVVIGPADLPINAGSNLIVYAVGSLGDDSLTVLTESIDGLGSAPSAVNTGNSPVSEASSTLPLVAAGGLLVVLAAAVALRPAVVGARH